MNLRVPHPLRSLQRVGYANVGIEILGSHPSQNARRTPDFLTKLPRPWPRVRLSEKKRSLSAPNHRLWLRTARFKSRGSATPVTTSRKAANAVVSGAA
jgi:hypothetical protein